MTSDSHLAMRQYSALGWVVLVGLLSVLAVGMYQFPQRVEGFVAPVLPRARLWQDPIAQNRMTVAPAPYELLRRADDLLPTDARVLLVTDGSEVRGREYVTFHRALYYLLPRPVWWMSPAPSDGTWEARWWLHAPLTAESILEVAHAKKASHVLLVPNVVRVEGANLLGEWGEGALLALDNSTPRAATARNEFAGEGWWWQTALALLAILLIGALVLMLAARAGIEIAIVEGTALAWALGAGSVSLVMLLLSMPGVPTEIQTVVLVSAAVVGAIGVARQVIARRRVRKEALNVPTWSARQMLGLVPYALLLVWLVVQTVYVGIIALGQPLIYWDSWVAWGIKARAIFIEQGIGPAVFSDPSRAVTHLDYPLLLPLTEAWLYQWLGAPDDRLVGWIAVAYYLAVVGICYGGARRLGANRLLALLGACVVGSIPTVTLLAGEVYADIPLALYALLTGIYLVHWVERGERGALLLAVCSAACLPWIKREGLVFLVALCGSALVLARPTARAWRGAAVCLAAGLTVAGGWQLLLAIHGTGNSDFMALSLATLIAQFDRLPTIANYFRHSLSSLQWNGIWLLVLVVGGVRVLVREKGETFQITPRDLLLAAPLLYLFLMGFSYLFSAFTPYINHLESSGYRLIAQVTPLVVVWVTLQAVKWQEG